MFNSDNLLFVIGNTGINHENVYLYNMIGQLIVSARLNGSSTFKLNLNVPTGYYLIKVVTIEQAYSSKVFIK